MILLNMQTNAVLQVPSLNRVEVRGNFPWTFQTSSVVSDGSPIGRISWRALWRRIRITTGRTHEAWGGNFSKLMYHIMPFCFFLYAVVSSVLNIGFEWRTEKHLGALSPCYWLIAQIFYDAAQNKVSSL